LLVNSMMKLILLILLQFHYHSSVLSFYNIISIMDKQNLQTIEDYLGRIQQIDEIARRTITEQEKRIPEKYSNIEATLKLLSNLINSFKKKSESYEL